MCEANTMQSGENSSEGTHTRPQSHYSTPQAGNSPPPLNNITQTTEQVSGSNSSNSNRSSSSITATTTTTTRNHSAIEYRDPRGAITTQPGPTLQRSYTQPIYSIGSNADTRSSTANNRSHDISSYVSSFNDPPPPPYPGLSRNEEQRAATVAALRLSQTSRTAITEDTPRNINVNRIPTITFEDNRSQYTGIMNRSLCLLVLCLLLCNVSSVLFTIPAVICSWMSVQADLNYQHQKAIKARKVALVCNWIAFVNFMILFLCGCLALGVYLLVRNEYVSVNF